MNNKFYILLCVFITCISCKSGDDKIEEGILTYSIEYPEIKDNFFLYHVLPKELQTSFKKDKMELKIKKAALENTLIIDNKAKKISSFYQYDETYFSKLNEEEIASTLNKHPKFSYKFTKKEDTLLGFKIKNVKVTSLDKKGLNFDLWYTDEIKIKNSNWFNGFTEIPGVLLKYSVIQYGMRMDFVAKKFENVPVSDSILRFKRPGKLISHEEYNAKINELFESLK